MWYSVLIAYLLIGVIIIVTTPARREVFGSFRDRDLAAAPAWKAHTFRIIVGSAALVFWPIFLPGWLRKKRSLWDELQENPIFQEQKALFDAMSKMCEDGCDTDEIPSGHGTFGYAATNPIPTKTVFGSTSYLARLRSSDGAKVVYEREGSLSSPVSPHPIDAYAISHPVGRRLATLYLSPYHKRNSEKAPRGFTLLKTIMG